MTLLAIVGMFLLNIIPIILSLIWKRSLGNLYRRHSLLIISPLMLVAFIFSCENFHIPIAFPEDVSRLFWLILIAPFLICSFDLVESLNEIIKG